MPNPPVHILVCVNKRAEGARKACCGSRSALEVYRRFKDAIRNRKLRDRVLATRTGCLKHCSLGVVVTVWPWNHWYQGVTLDDVDEILQSAADADPQPIERLLVPANADWE